MDTMIKLAIERMSEQIDSLTEKVKLQQAEINELKKQKVIIAELPQVVRADEFINTKEVKSMLGVCYNTLQQVVNKGLLTPIRINQRRIRYSKQAVLNYLNGAR
jgi:Fic family protein